MDQETDATTATVTSPVRPGFTTAELEELRDAFNLFDTKGTGTIQAKELKEVIESLGMDSKPNVAQVMQVLEAEESGGEIDFDKFVNILTARIGDDRDDLRRVFDLFDDDQKGYITIDNLKRVATDLGETMTEEELQEMIKHANAQDEGKVSPEEFYTIMTKKLMS